MDRPVTFRQLLIILVVSITLVLLVTVGRTQVSNPSAMPSGLIMFMVSGSCPSGMSEYTSLNGKSIQGTLVANGDAGGSIGSVSITPSGTVSQPAFTGTQFNFTTAANVSLLGAGTALTGPASYTPAGTISQPTFTGNSFDPTPLSIKVIACRAN